MRAYLGTTAALFALLTLAHLWRLAAESARFARDPWFVLTTVLSVAMCAWALRLLRTSRAPAATNVLQR